MNIQSIKLVTGEELVAKVTFISDTGQVTIDDPLVLQVTTGPKGLVVNFFPWTIIAKGEIKIEAHAIVARFPVPQDVQDSYIQNTTGLQIVSATPQLLKG